jgi:hypothetical protein
MSFLRTGAILHSRSRSFFGATIRLFTGLEAVVKGDWVPNHTAILVQDDGVLWVYESTSFVGARRIPFAEWKKKHKDFRITHLPLVGHREALKDALNSYLGRKYESWWSLILVPFNKAKRGRKRLYCTEYIVAALKDANVPMAQKLVPHDTDPAEFYERIS